MYRTKSISSILLGVLRVLGGQIFPEESRPHSIRELFADPILILFPRHLHEGVLKGAGGAGLGFDFV